MSLISNAFSSVSSGFSGCPFAFLGEHVVNFG